MTSRKKDKSESQTSKKSLKSEDHQSEGEKILKKGTKAESMKEKMMNIGQFMFEVSSPSVNCESCKLEIYEPE